MLKFFITFVMQMKKSTVINRLIKRKIATAVLIMASVVAFATLGDGGGKKNKSLLIVSKSTDYSYKNFSLRSNFNYRGNNIFSYPERNKFIMLNTTITYQKGNSAYILPMKKKVFLDKVKINSIPR